MLGTQEKEKTWVSVSLEFKFDFKIIFKQADYQVSLSYMYQITQKCMRQVEELFFFICYKSRNCTKALMLKVVLSLEFH